MKNFKHIFTSLSVLFLLFSCDQGIDGITEVDPGSDASSPVVTINYPTEGTKIKVQETVTTIMIDFEVTDDIEVASVSVLIDGDVIKNYNEFKDYRRVLVDDLAYNKLNDGSHTLTVVAKDIDGKNTTVSVNFTKEPAYTPLYAGEVFYMPFDDSYTDLISFKTASKIGTPIFNGEGFAGANAYKGTAESYLKFPTEGLLTTAFSGTFWYKVNANPDRAGILVIGDDEADRFQGFRLFREGNGSEQRLKLNVGTGNGESWNDGGVLNVAAGEWVHVAFTISQSKSTIYFNGVEMLSANMSASIDWTGCESITIGSGGDTFGYWGHKYDSSAMDELRFFNKALTQAEIQTMLNGANPYTSKFDGETFYMPFDGDNKELNSNTDPTVVGATGFAGAGVVGGNSFAGATDSYLTFPTAGLFGEGFSGAFWYKVDASPDRAGILVVGDNADDRNQGFRLFREGSATEQRIKLNVGTGNGESWNDGGVIDVTAGEWVHIAFSVSATKSTIYFNGVETLSSTLGAGVDWTGTQTLTIGAGGETFSYWNHLSDSSYIDELYLFNKALTKAEIEMVMNEGL